MSFARVKSFLNGMLFQFILSKRLNGWNCFLNDIGGQVQIKEQKSQGGVSYGYNDTMTIMIT